MGVIHGLEGDAGVIAVEVAVLDKVLDCVDHLGPVRGAMKQDSECLIVPVPSSAGSLVPCVPQALRNVSCDLCVFVMTERTLGCDWEWLREEQRR